MCPCPRWAACGARAKILPNTGWRNGGFRGFADYMLTEEFQNAQSELIRMSREKRVAIMCAEAVPWRCHRSLVADALSVRGVTVVEILSESSYRMHKLTPFRTGRRHANHLSAGARGVVVKIPQ